MTHPHQLLTRKNLVLALTSALAVMAPMVAKAGAFPCGSSGTITAYWSAGDCTIPSTGSVIVTSGTGVAVSGSPVGTLTNSGTISGGSVGFANVGYTISELNNANGDTISGGNQGISNDGTIGILTNSGIISGSQYGIALTYPDPTGAVINSGTITGAVDAIYNEAPSLGQITNSGVIAGNIENDSSNDLSISGGTGTIFGTLTGYGGG